MITHCHVDRVNNNRLSHPFACFGLASFSCQSFHIFSLTAPLIYCHPSIVATPMQTLTTASVLFFILLFFFCSVLLLQSKRIIPPLFDRRFQPRPSGSLWPNEPLLVHSNRQRWSRLKDTYPQMDMSLLLARRRDDNATGKTLTYFCKGRCGGFGDRMRGIMAGYILALITDRHFMIDMTFPIDLAEFLRPNFYNWTFVQPKVDKSRSSISMHAIDTPSGFLSNMQNQSFLQEWAKYDDITLVTSIDFVADILRNPSVQKTPIVELLAKHIPPVQLNMHSLFPLVFDILFSPTPRIVDALQPILEPIQNGSTMICIHIRLGSNPSNPLDETFKNIGSAVEDTLSFLNQTKWMDNRTSRLFVTSDSALAMKKFADRYPKPYSHGARSHPAHRSTSRRRESHRRLHQGHCGLLCAG